MTNRDNEDIVYCEGCNGSGEGSYDGERCRWCRGTGLAKSEEIYGYEY